MTPLPSGLTHREDAVVELVSRGFGLREIARQLQLSERQATRSRDRAREKLGASNQAELVRRWMESGGRP